MSDNLSIELPENLIFANSQLTVSFERHLHVNSTDASILIKGSRGGFLSLANAILYLLNDLRDEIDLNELTYVNSPIRLTICVDETVRDAPYGAITKQNDREFLWRISEAETCRVASEIHSLGHLNSELHFDEGKQASEISIYCVVT